MPAPAGLMVLVAASIVLLISGIALLLLARRPSDRVLSSVALGNTSVAFVVAFWMLAGWTRFSVSGRLLVAVTVAAFLSLAVGELLATFEDESLSRVQT